MWLAPRRRTRKFVLITTTQARTAYTMNEERQQAHRVAFLGTHNWRGEAGLLPRHLDHRVVHWKATPGPAVPGTALTFNGVHAACCLLTPAACPDAL